MDFKKIDITEFAEKTADEMQDALQKKLDEFKTQVAEVKDEEELKQLELDIDKAQEEFDKYLREAEYELNQDGIDFENKNYKMNEITRKIVYHLNRIEQEFQYCLGLHGLVLFWKQHKPEKISYGAYDSTLRLLGQLKYKGDSEWVDILIINNYLVCAHEPYMKDRAMLVYLAECRNAAVNQLQLVTPVVANPEEEQQQQQQ